MIVIHKVWLWSNITKNMLASIKKSNHPQNVWVPTTITASPCAYMIMSTIIIAYMYYKSTSIGRIACAELPKTKRDQCLSKPNIHVQITIANSCADCAFRRNCQKEKCTNPLMLRHTNIWDHEPGVTVVHLLLRAQISRVHVSHSGNMPPSGKSDLPPSGKSTNFNMPPLGKSDLPPPGKSANFNMPPPGKSALPPLCKSTNFNMPPPGKSGT